MKKPNTIHWFPKKSDYIYISPTQGKYAQKFFMNGLGVKIWHYQVGEEWMYQIKLLKGSPKDYVEYSNPNEVFPTHDWGYNMFALANSLRKIRQFESNPMK